MSGGKLSSTSLTSKRLPVKAEREADREAGEKALWARVSLGWFWLQEDMKTGGGHERRARASRRIISSCRKIYFLSVCVCVCPAAPLSAGLLLLREDDSKGPNGAAAGGAEVSYRTVVVNVGPSLWTWRTEVRRCFWTRCLLRRFSLIHVFIQHIFNFELSTGSASGLSSCGLCPLWTCSPVCVLLGTPGAGPHVHQAPG